MKTSKIKQAMATVALLCGATAAHANFVTIDSSAAAAQSIGIVTNNDFRTNLANVGITSYTLGASLGLTVGGYVTLYYYGKEAGYRNDFSLNGSTFSTGFDPTRQNYFGAPVELGTIEARRGLLDLQFCAFDWGPQARGCVTNAQNDTLSLGSYQSIAMNVLDNVAWLFWDDSGAGPDDNHDDMLIRAVFTPSTAVPEPGTLALFGLGLLGAGLARRRARA